MVIQSFSTKKLLNSKTISFQRLTVKKITKILKNFLPIRKLSNIKFLKTKNNKRKFQERKSAGNLSHRLTSFSSNKPSFKMSLNSFKQLISKVILHIKIKKNKRNYFNP